MVGALCQNGCGAMVATNVGCVEGQRFQGGGGGGSHAGCRDAVSPQSLLAAAAVADALSNSESHGKTPQWGSQWQSLRHLLPQQGCCAQLQLRIQRYKSETLDLAYFPQEVLIG